VLDEPSNDPNEKYLAYGVLCLSMLLVALFLFAMRYEISKDHLVVKIGPIPFSKISIDEISLVERSYNPLSSPASSLKRLYIKAKNKDVLISPVDEQEFVRLLKTRNPNITVNISDKDNWWRFWDWDI
jgi:hypothetical protein